MTARNRSTSAFARRCLSPCTAVPRMSSSSHHTSLIVSNIFIIWTTTATPMSSTYLQFITKFQLRLLLSMIGHFCVVAFLGFIFFIVSRMCAIGLVPCNSVSVNRTHRSQSPAIRSLFQVMTGRGAKVLRRTENKTRYQPGIAKRCGVNMFCSCLKS